MFVAFNNRNTQRIRGAYHVYRGVHLIGVCSTWREARSIKAQSSRNRIVWH